MNRPSNEKGKLAVINLTEAHPDEYRIAELSRWSKVSVCSLRKLDDLIGLKIKRARCGGRGSGKVIKEDIRDYYYCGKLKQLNSRKRIHLYLAMSDFIT